MATATTMPKAATPPDKNICPRRCAAHCGTSPAAPATRKRSPSASPGGAGTRTRLEAVAFGQPWVPDDREQRRTRVFRRPTIGRHTRVLLADPQFPPTDLLGRRARHPRLSVARAAPAAV